MTRLRYGDVVVEMSDLAADILDDIRQQTTYYKASVYKDEALEKIARCVENLAFISRIVKNDALAECVHDYEAAEEFARSQQTSLFNDEQPVFDPAQVMNCSVSSRVMHLLLNAGKVIQAMRLSARDPNLPEHARQVVTAVSRHRRDLVSMSRHGSRSWQFLQGL
ncbi:MAG: hypothetical protein RIQ81_977 [Pseudomonadota bacterium]|jgi:hypothetical protein